MPILEEFQLSYVWNRSLLHCVGIGTLFTMQNDLPKSSQCVILTQGEEKEGCAPFAAQPSHSLQCVGLTLEHARAVHKSHYVFSLQHKRPCNWWVHEDCWLFEGPRIRRSLKRKQKNHLWRRGERKELTSEIHAGLSLYDSVCRLKSRPIGAELGDSNWEQFLEKAQFLYVPLSPLPLPPYLLFPPGHHSSKSHSSVRQ